MIEVKEGEEGKLIVVTPENERFTDKPSSHVKDPPEAILGNNSPKDSA
jgi:hypothetical protein